MIYVVNNSKLDIFCCAQYLIMLEGLDLVECRKIPARQKAIRDVPLSPRPKKKMFNRGEPKWALERK